MRAARNRGVEIPVAHLAEYSVLALLLWRAVRQPVSRILWISADPASKPLPSPFTNGSFTTLFGSPEVHVAVTAGSLHPGMRSKSRMTMRRR